MAGAPGATSPACCFRCSGCVRWPAASSRPRRRRLTARAKVVDAQLLEGNVIALKFEKPQFSFWGVPKPYRYKTGQYVRIMCPEISTFEWHPFTISSAPGDQFMTLHIKVGGWGEWVRWGGQQSLEAQQQYLILMKDEI